MYAMVILYDPTRAGNDRAYGNLHISGSYFEFVVIIIFEDEGCGSCLMDEVEFILVGYWDHLGDESCWFASPGNGSGHILNITNISQTIKSFSMTSFKDRRKEGKNTNIRRASG
jgi:hypothetical protein